MVHKELEKKVMLVKHRPMHSMIDSLFDQHAMSFNRMVKLACLPEDGEIITRSRMVTERFKVEYKDDGTIVYNPITEDKDVTE